jgi:hypothetical protein
MMLKTKLILERFDKDHQLLERREQPSRSWVLGFFKLLYVAHAQITSVAPYSMNDITNTARDIDSQGTATNRAPKGTLRIGAPGGAAYAIGFPGTLDPTGATHIEYMSLAGETVGIVVGTGVGAVTPTDIALGTRVAHGRAAGQFEYGGCELVGIAFADPNGEFTMRRYFTNLSGGGITVQEAGIYAIGTKYDGASAGWAYPFCVARDITGAVAVADTEILRVTYVIQITV